MSAEAAVTRDAGLFEFHRLAPGLQPGGRSWLARTQNAWIRWCEASGPDGTTVESASDDESMVLVFGGTAELIAGAAVAPAPPRSVALLPPGRAWVRLPAGASCAWLTTGAAPLPGAAAFNEAHYAQPDPRVRPAHPAYRRRRPLEGIEVIPIDSFAAPADNPRIKMLQSATLSLNWVEYDGLRDRRSLSPHSHDDLEQASLGVAGHFVHHLRERWGRNAELWREDRHVELAPPSLLTVPVNLIHTSEGVRPERHLLVDIFSPPRADFIARGWVHNAGDYAAPGAAGGAEAPGAA